MAPKTQFPPRGGRSLIRGIDWLVRRFKGIIEFDRSEDGLICIALVRVEQQARLADGTHLQPGDAVVELHLWNEHLLRVPARGSDLRRATALRRGGVESLRRLAAYMLADRRFDDIKALRIEPAVGGVRAAATLTRMVARYGFEVALDGGGAPAASWLFRIFDNFWMSLLSWTFNPVSLRRWRSDRRRRAFWISRARFIARFGGDAVSVGVEGTSVGP
jgi:hypothetical protein